MSSYSEDLHSAALAYHRLPRPGKLEIQATKPLANQRDLALAYSPGVAAACTEIANNPAEAASLTARAISWVYWDPKSSMRIFSVMVLRSYEIRQKTGLERLPGNKGD